MNNLPDNSWLTSRYCNRFSGLLILDGKHIKVKGYQKKIPFIYGIDYLTHDIPVGILAPSESSEAFKKYFRILKTCNYPLKAVICDDVIDALKQAVLYYYPKTKIQLCQNHYLENIRQLLKVRTLTNHYYFFHSLVKHVFKDYTDESQLNRALHHVFTKRARKDIVRQSIVMDIHRRREELFAYANIPHCPHNTNLLELFNSHVNARLNALKGFKSFHSAERWLNAWVLRRRTKPFTDCKGRFRHLNGKSSLEISIKEETSWPNILGVKAPKMKR